MKSAQLLRDTVYSLERETTEYINECLRTLLKEGEHLTEESGIVDFFNYPDVIQIDLISIDRNGACYFNNENDGKHHISDYLNSQDIDIHDYIGLLEDLQYTVEGVEIQKA